jgi:hypothetical protein
MHRFHLPTKSMLRRGIPEGVVNNGGFIRGFLYFQKPSSGDHSLEFTAKLVDARSGQQLGTIRVPFIVER